MQIITVSQALSYLRELLETDFLMQDVWISGEVSGPRTQPSGHTYFTLKDATAQLRGVLFRGSNIRQNRIFVEHLQHGAQVIVHGRVSVYEARGDLQVVVDFVQPEGVGLRQAQFERLRAQLEEEGLFDESRKRKLPAFPRRIGVVTSPAGAVFHDICNVLTRRWPMAEVVLAPTPVQGPEAPYGVVGAIETLNLEGVDVIIVARGGGSIEELWTFNEEMVARAVFGSLIPVVSAVGHETDYTICDFVADVRAPTPSAAAEIVAPDAQQFRARLAGIATYGVNLLQHRLEGHRKAVEGLLIRARRAGVDPNRERQRIDDLARRAHRAFEASERQRRDHLRRCLAQLDALNPQATLDRGYAVVHKDGRVVSSIGSVGSGDGLVIKVADGGFPARVDAPGQRRPRSRTTLKRPSTNGNSAGIQPVLFP